MLFFVFFFKQKTAYEMRISDWSSDVCSSDLGGAQVRRERPPELEVVRRVVERRAHQHPLVDFDALAHAARSPPMRPLSSCSMSPTAAQANGTECSAGRRSPSSDAPIRSTIAADCCSSWWARSDCATVMPVWTADRDRKSTRL